jgi:hypothetical protein
VPTPKARPKAIVGVLPIHKATCPRAKVKGDERWQSCLCRPTFRAQVSDAVTGHVKTKTFPSASAAHAWRQDRQAALRAGRTRNVAPCTLGELWAEFYENVRDGTELNSSHQPYRASVTRAYEGAWRNWLAPAIGSRPVADLRTREIQDLINGWSKAGAAGSSINNRITCLRVLLGYAKRRELVATNACTDLRIPKNAIPRDRIASPGRGRGADRGPAARGRPRPVGRSVPRWLEAWGASGARLVLGRSTCPRDHRFGEL